MAEITDIPSALDALNAFRYNLPASTPEPLAEFIIAATAQVSPVDTIMGSVEPMYAYLGDLTIAGKELLLGLASLATTFGWHGLAGTEQRGMGIINAVHRELGHEPTNGEWPDPEDDPEPLERYAPAPPPAPPPLPEVPEG
jgi:hypothetical protein